MSRRSPRRAGIVLGLAALLPVSAMAALEQDEDATGRAAVAGTPIGTSGIGSQLGAPLDQGLDDVGPLGTSLRTMQVDLRDPAAFAQVYAVPGRDNMVMRADGGIFAVFPRSVYLNNGNAVAPNDTIFHIGLGSLLGADWYMPEAAAEARQFEGRLDTRSVSAMRQLPLGSREETIEASAEVSPSSSTHERTSFIGGSGRHGLDSTLGATLDAELGSGIASALRAIESVDEEALLSADRLRTLMRRAVAAERSAQAARGPSSPSSSK